MSIRLARPLIVGLLVLAIVSLAGCVSAPQEVLPEPPQQAQPQPQPAAPASPGKTADVTELKVEDLVVGTGLEAVAGKTVTVNYTGWLTDGSQFDSSLDPGREPFSFALGAAEVIVGWDEGVSGMKVGGKRTLTIPPAKAYGPEGRPPVIPPNATLVFQVELLGVQ